MILGVKHASHLHIFAMQSELYSLASPGGPHYAPRAVRVSNLCFICELRPHSPQPHGLPQAAAMSALDATYPLGRRTRRVVRTLFRLLHPTDWLGEFWLAPLHWWVLNLTLDSH